MSDLKVIPLYVVELTVCSLPRPTPLPQWMCAA